MNAVAQTEIARYVDAVRAELSDLSPQERDDLLEDLHDHLAEVAAEGDGSLEDRLGSPAAYAAELRASAGLAARRGREETFAERLSAIAGEVGLWLRQVDIKAGPVLGYARASEFLRLLRPAWWVARGYLAAMLVAWMLDETSSEPGLLPRIGGSDVAALVMLVGFVLASIWLGRRTDRLSVWPRRAIGAGGVVLMLFAFAGFDEADGRVRWPAGYDTVYSNPYEHIQDVYVYDVQGKLVENARLFDQNGQPIQLGNAYCLETPSDFTIDGIPPYPRCPDRAPFNLEPLTVTPDQSATPTPEPSPTPTPEPTEGPSPSVTTPSEVATPSPTPR